MISLTSIIQNALCFAPDQLERLHSKILTAHKQNRNRKSIEIVYSLSIKSKFAYIFLAIFQHNLGEWLQATNMPVCNGKFAIGFDLLQMWWLWYKGQFNCVPFFVSPNIIFHFALILAQIRWLHFVYH